MPQVVVLDDTELRSFVAVFSRGQRRFFRAPLSSRSFISNRAFLFRRLVPVTPARRDPTDLAASRLRGKVVDGEGSARQDTPVTPQSHER